MINLIITSLALALVAFVYSDVLTEPGMILNRLYLWLDERIPEWIVKPLIGCYKCVAGQMALWYFLFHYEFNLIHLIFFISLTIYLSHILCKIYRKEN